MPAESEHLGASGPDNQSKMDVIEAALKILEAQQQKLDSAGFSMASIHLNDAIERLRSDQATLISGLKP